MLIRMGDGGFMTLLYQHHLLHPGPTHQAPASAASAGSPSPSTSGGTAVSGVAGAGSAGGWALLSFTPAASRSWGKKASL